MLVLISGLISVVGCIGLILYCCLAPSKSEAYDRTLSVFANSSYYIVLTLVVVWAAQLVIYLRAQEFSPKEFLKRNWLEISFALVATAICFISVQSEFRVMSDEANLLSVSENLFLRKRALNITGAEHYFGNLQVIQEMPDKRPLLFPFMVCLIHLVRGFNASNPFVANGIIFFLLLAGAAIAVQRLIGRAAAIAAVILPASYPLICLCATSGGFDLIAAVLLCASLLALAYFLRQPNAEAFAVLWMTLLAFGHTRYESILAFPVVVTCVAAFGYVRLEYFQKYAHVYALTPWFLVPLGLQRALTMNSTGEGHTGPLFGQEYLVKNLDEVLQTFTNFTYNLPYPTLLNILAMICLIWLVMALILGSISIKESWQRHLVAAIAVITVGYALFLLSYFFGRAVHPSSARIFVYFAIIAALMPVIFRHYFPEIMNDYVLISVACLSAILYHSISIEDRFANTQHIIREVDAEYDFLDRHRIELDFLNRNNDKRFLVICDRPVNFIAMGYGALDFAEANDHYRAYMDKLNAHLFLGYIVFQRIEYGTNQPVVGDRLGDQWDLNVQQQLEIRGKDDDSPGEYLRISLVSPAIK